MLRNLFTSDGTNMPVVSPGLGESQQRLLNTIKLQGTATIPELAEAIGLNVETVRDHLRKLSREALIEQRGRRRSGPGRPEILYGLTGLGESLFPTREAELLEALARHLVESGNHDLLDAFYAKHLAARRRDALARVSGLEGRERLDEVARILTEEGFMARIEEECGEPILRLCHCPVRALVYATRTPCRIEVAFIHELLGERLSRVSYIPAGDSACSYARRPSVAAD